MPPASEPAGTTFEEDVSFLSKHVQPLVLGVGEARIAVVGAYQGRVMTSTDGKTGLSYGWINRSLIASGKLNKHINAFGGEDRFWLGPEGGQFSVFFKNGEPFDLAHWQTPACIDSEPFELVRRTPSIAEYQRHFELENYGGTRLCVEVQRKISVLGKRQAEIRLGGSLPRELSLVAYESSNTIRNTGQNVWDEDRGMLSIWILGMYNAGDDTTVAIPVKPGPAAKVGPAVNDNYFDKVPSNRLRVNSNVVYFKADAKFRSKIGVSPRRALPVLGSYDPKSGVLTIVQYTLPAEASKYVNSSWEIQANPFGGDVVNSYNDGPPPTGGSQLGAFYELETSSPALGLKPGESATHVHRTFHLQGDAKALDSVAKSVLGAGLAQIRSGLK